MCWDFSFFISFFFSFFFFKRGNIGRVKLFWLRCTQEIVFVPVRGSQCLPSIPGGLFCHRLCAARHGRGRRQRVGQPSPTAVLLHPGTRRPPSQYENKFSSLFAINFPLRRWRRREWGRGEERIGLDNITYSRLCTENLAVHRIWSNFSLCWEQLSRTYSSPCASRLAGGIQQSGRSRAEPFLNVFHMTVSGTK